MTVFVTRWMQLRPLSESEREAWDLCLVDGSPHAPRDRREETVAYVRQQPDGLWTASLSYFHAYGSPPRPWAGTDGRFGTREEAQTWAEEAWKLYDAAGRLGASN